MKIIPAILENDFDKIKEKLEFIKSQKEKHNLNIDTVQIDISDGVFVKNKTWLPNESVDSGEIEYLRSFNNLNNIQIEYHLMCKFQINYIREVLKLNPGSIVIHVDGYVDDYFEYQDLDMEVMFEVIKLIKSNVKVRLCLDNNLLSNNIDSYVHYLNVVFDLVLKSKESDLLDFKSKDTIGIQFMGIDKIGFQGQTFNNNVIKYINDIKTNIDEKFKDQIIIQVDGGVNFEVAKSLRQAGADNLVVGSYLLNGLDEDIFLNNFNQLISL